MEKDCKNPNWTLDKLLPEESFLGFINKDLNKFKTLFKMEQLNKHTKTSKQNQTTK